MRWVSWDRKPAWFNNTALDSESHLVRLDWYAAHMDPAVVELIKSRGHVLLMHGGGTTDYVQLNDTNLHANGPLSDLPDDEKDGYKPQEEEPDENPPVKPAEDEGK